MCKTFGILITVGKSEHQIDVETGFLVMDKSQVINILRSWDWILKKIFEKF